MLDERATTEVISAKELQTDNTGPDSGSLRSSQNFPDGDGAQQPAHLSDDDLPEKEMDLEKQPTHKSRTAGAPVRRAVTAQDWEGPDDPENPHNWSTAMKAYHVIIPGLYGFIV